MTDADRSTEASRPFYTESHRHFQGIFDSDRLADRLTEVTVHDHLDDRTQAFISSASYFYLATVDDGWPDVSYKGGLPGFVRVHSDTALSFPSYDGNGMYRSVGNIHHNPRIAMLFIRQDSRPARIRVHGRAVVDLNPDVVKEYPGAEAVIHVVVTRSFFNCPRYVHDLTADTYSEYAPDGTSEPPQPEWKSWDLFAEVLPRPTGD